MMKRAPLPRAALAALTLTLLIAPAGCEEEKGKPLSSDAGTSESTSNAPLLGGKLGEAVAAAEASATAKAKAPSGSGALDGPPEKGIFEPSAGEKAHPRGAPPKLDLLAEGSEPRVALSSRVEPGAQRKVIMTLGLRAQAPIDIDFAVTFKAEKPKEDKKAAEDAAKKPDEAGAPAGQLIVGKVTSASLSEGQRGDDDQIAKLFGKLKGSQIRFTASPEGAASDLRYELAKDADPNLETALQALIEGLTTMIAPLPAKPVGAGGYWMVTDRARASGVEVIRYRVFRVTKIEGNQVSTALDLRQYSTEEGMRVPGVQQKDVVLKLDRFESRGKGEISWAGASFLPSTAEVANQLQALIIPPGQTNQRGQIQTETRLKLISRSE